jgi:tetraacyldisaccharide-1-P 4'-kinase
MISRLAEQARSANADGVVMTAKDAVKLTTAMRRQLQSIGSVAVGDIVVRLCDEASFIAELLRRAG